MAAYLYAKYVLYEIVIPIVDMPANLKSIGLIEVLDLRIQMMTTYVECSTMVEVKVTFVHCSKFGSIATCLKQRNFL